MIKLFSVTISLLAMFSCEAQSSYTMINLNKKPQPGLQLAVSYNADIAEGTILQKLKETGYTPETKGSLFWKKNKQDGFYVFNGIVLPELYNQKLDLFFKVETLGKKKQALSTIYLLVSKGNENFVSPESDASTFKAATNFLNGFVAQTASYNLQLNIDDQEKVVKNAEKKLVNLQEDQRSIEKKIEQLQADLVKKKNDQILQEKEIADQKVKLEELKAKR